MRRGFATVENVAGATARGGHISLSFGASGGVTGLGAALETTLHIPSTAGLTGTVRASAVHFAWPASIDKPNSACSLPAESDGVLEVADDSQRRDVALSGKHAQDD